MRFLIAFRALPLRASSFLPWHCACTTRAEIIALRHRAHWDCGIIENHNRYAEIHHIPVAAIGIAG